MVGIGCCVVIVIIGQINKVGEVGGQNHVGDEGRDAAEGIEISVRFDEGEEIFGGFAADLSWGRGGFGDVLVAEGPEEDQDREVEVHAGFYGLVDALLHCIVGVAGCEI